MKVEEVNLVINRTPCCTDVEIRRAVSGTRHPYPPSSQRHFKKLIILARSFLSEERERERGKKREFFINGALTWGGRGEGYRFVFYRFTGHLYCAARRRVHPVSPSCRSRVVKLTRAANFFRYYATSNAILNFLLLLLLLKKERDPF